MAISECGTVKEQTIRDLVHGSRKAQAEITAQLDISFARNPEKLEPDSGKPSCANVLDEIISDLRDLIDNQRRTIEFIATSINPKL